MRPQNDNRRQFNDQPKEFEEKVIQVNRVSKKTKGGSRISFSVLMVVGDKKGRVGVGLGKSPNVLSSIQKGIRRAKKHMIKVPIKNGTIPFPITIKQGAAKLMLKPAPIGTGVIAGGAVRAVVEAAGINNIVSKTLGGSNQASNVYATFTALQKIKQIAEIKGIKLESSTQATPAQPVRPVRRSFQPQPVDNRRRSHHPTQPNQPEASKPSTQPPTKPVIKTPSEPVKK